MADHCFSTNHYCQLWCCSAVAVVAGPERLEWRTLRHNDAPGRKVQQTAHNTTGTYNMTTNAKTACCCRLWIVGLCGGGARHGDECATMIANKYVYVYVYIRIQADDGAMGLGVSHCVCCVCIDAMEHIHVRSVSVHAYERVNCAKRRRRRRKRGRRKRDNIPTCIAVHTVVYSTCCSMSQ